MPKDDIVKRIFKKRYSKKAEKQNITGIKIKRRRRR